MTPENAAAHERAIRDQFSRQAVGFAAAPELHADDIVALVVHAAATDLLRLCKYQVRPSGRKLIDA
jgi:hypothetical protein